MADIGKSRVSLRLDRHEISRLIVVLSFSLGIHMIAFGGYEFGKELHLFPWLHWLAHVRQLPPPAPATDPVEFQMVQDPSTETPKNAKYYGAHNSVAADNTKGNQDQAKIDGKQTEIPLPQTGSKVDPNKLQPALQPNLHPMIDPGDLTIGKAPPPQDQAKPQKLSEVQPMMTPGLQMRQEGAAHRAALVPSFDVKASPFGLYDERFIEAVQQKWYDLLDEHHFALDRSGKVVLRFHLNYDGSITDMTVVENSVGALYGQVCQDAIHDPAPFAEWPPEMRHQLGQTFREITFTFYYY